MRARRGIPMRAEPKPVRPFTNCARETKRQAAKVCATRVVEMNPMRANEGGKKTDCRWFYERVELRNISFASSFVFWKVSMVGDVSMGASFNPNNFGNPNNFWPRNCETKSD